MTYNLIVVLLCHLCFASFQPPNGYFYIFCRTFGPTLFHFLSDIYKKCLIVRQVRRISTALQVFIMIMMIVTIFVSPAKHSDTWGSLCPSSVRPSVRLSHFSVTLFCHTFQSYVSQATHAFLGMLPLFFLFFKGNVRCRQVVLEELITVCPEKSLSHSSTPKSAKKKLAQPNHETHLYVEMQPIHPVSFSVYMLKRTTNYKWRKKKVTFFCGSGNERLCEVWVSKIKAAISDKSKLTLDLRFSCFTCMM